MNRLRALMIDFSSIALSQAAPAWAQSATPQPVVQRTATPALWVVKDADTTIYLFGTIHLLPDGLNWNLGAVKSAFESADTLKLEIASLDADMSSIQATVASLGSLPAGQSLTDGMTDAQKTQLSRVAADAGIPAQGLNPIRPWMASIVLTGALVQKMGFDANKGVDKTLDTLARARNVPVEGFETGAQQVGFFAAMPEAQQREMFLSTLDEWDAAPAQLTSMLQAWSRGDANRVGTMISRSLRSQPELARVLLTDRNSIWADWIGARMATPGTVFVAVGAGHLAGRDSVQSFLRKKGLRAQRVTNAAPPR